MVCFEPLLGVHGEWHKSGPLYRVGHQLLGARRDHAWREHVLLKSVRRQVLWDRLRFLRREALARLRIEVRLLSSGAAIVVV
jgi:hypothetical protein